MVLNKDINNIFDFKYEDFSLEDYDSYDAIKGDLSV
jgi:thymidylate synthase